MAAGRKETRQASWRLWRTLRFPAGFWRTMGGFWTAVVAIIGTLAALVTILAYVDVWEHRGFFESGQYATAIVREDPMHIGDTPRKNTFEFFGASHSLFFDAPQVETSQMAVLTFEIADVRAPRYMELNGTLLPEDPVIQNTNSDTWDTVFIVLTREQLKSSGNELLIKALNSEGETTGDIDDIFIRNIAILYRTQ